MIRRRNPMPRAKGREPPNDATPTPPRRHRRTNFLFTAPRINFEVRLSSGRQRAGK